MERVKMGIFEKFKIEGYGKAFLLISNKRAYLYDFEGKRIDVEECENVDELLERFHSLGKPMRGIGSDGTEKLCIIGEPGELEERKKIASAIIKAVKELNLDIEEQAVNALLGLVEKEVVVSPRALIHREALGSPQQTSRVILEASDSIKNIEERIEAIESEMEKLSYEILIIRGEITKALEEKDMEKIDELRMEEDILIFAIKGIRRKLNLYKNMLGIINLRNSLEEKGLWEKLCEIPLYKLEEKLEMYDYKLINLEELVSNLVEGA
jgi:hypothetical protein